MLLYKSNKHKWINKLELDYKGLRFKCEYCFFVSQSLVQYFLWMWLQFQFHSSSILMGDETTWQNLEG